MFSNFNQEELAIFEKAVYTMKNYCHKVSIGLESCDNCPLLNDNDDCIMISLDEIVDKTKKNTR